MSQVPSDRRVTTVPSGWVTLDVETDRPLLEPAVAVTPVVDVAVLAAEDAVFPPEWVVIVRPSIAVDDDTLPPPAVTEDDSRLLAVVPTPEASVTVQVVPSSRVTSCDEAATAMLPIRMIGKAIGRVKSA